MWVWIDLIIKIMQKNAIKNLFMVAQSLRNGVAQRTLVPPDQLLEAISI